MRSVAYGAAFALGTCLLTSFSLHAEDPPIHYFIGQVCQGSKQAEMKPPNYPCKKPIRGVTVTLRNSIGEELVAVTDRDGKYTLQPMPLAGHDDDKIAFMADGFAGLRISGLRFNPDVQHVSELGATILLPREREKTVVLH